MLHRAGHVRGTSNSNTRGSSYDRRRRREWLVHQFGNPSGKTIPCFHCGKPLRTSTLRHPNGTFEVDRFPICGHDGGRYVIGNIVPSCARCNGRRCATKHCRAHAPLVVSNWRLGLRNFAGEMRGAV